MAEKLGDLSQGWYKDKCNCGQKFWPHIFTIYADEEEEGEMNLTCRICSMCGALYAHTITGLV